MITINKRTSWIVLLALLLIFAGCKGETPTAPPPGGGIPPGGTTPPTGVNLTVTASNTSPFVDNTVIITATVTDNGQPVPNGTAVEFTTTNGSFTDVTPGVQSLIRTTINGAATVNLTSSTPVVARVTATVNNISRFVDVTFRAVVPCVPPDPRCPANETPTITSVTPASGRPDLAQTIRITGTNFIAPLRVLFDVGAPLPAEGVIVNSGTTFIDVLTPLINLGAAQQFASDITVITRAGAANEQRAIANDAFTFQNEVLTPIVHSLSPTSGPINGGTRVTIFGSGFQEPMQVFFGSAEAQIVTIQFGQVLVIAPDARSTNPNGSGAVTGPVDVSLVNIRSNTRTTSPQAFRYIAAMQITAAGPTQGPSTGGTRVTIDGIGFDPPVAVSIGGFAAQPINVSGTQVIAVTLPLDLTSCADVSGPISVTNIENGDGATGPTFTYRAPRPVVLSVSPLSVLAGASVTVRVANAIPGLNRITIAGRITTITGETFNADGTADFTVTIPSNITFQTEACSVGGVAGTRQIPLLADVTYTNLGTGCTNTADDLLEIRPCAVPPCPCNLPPPPEVTQVVPVPPNCANAGSVSVTDPATGTATITFANDGGQPLNVILASITGANPGDFNVAPAAIVIAPGQTGSFTVTFNPSAVGARSADANFSTNDPDEGSITVCLSGTGNP